MEWYLLDGVESVGRNVDPKSYSYFLSIPFFLVFEHTNDYIVFFFVLVYHGFFS